MPCTILKRDLPRNLHILGFLEYPSGLKGFGAVFGRECMVNGNDWLQLGDVKVGKVKWLDLKGAGCHE